LANGGLSIRGTLCASRCPHRHDCEAKEGYEGDVKPRVIVGPHALLGRISRSTGSRGLVVIDEPDQHIEEQRVNMRSVELTRACLGAFETEDAIAMLPALAVATAVLRDGELGELQHLSTLALDDIDVQTACIEANASTPAEAAVGAFDPRRTKGG